MIDTQEHCVLDSNLADTILFQIEKVFTFGYQTQDLHWQKDGWTILDHNVCEGRPLAIAMQQHVVAL